MPQSTPDICDAFPDDVEVCEIAFRAFGQRASFGGEIVTVKCFEDNSLVKEVLARDGSGKVLVVDGGGSMRRALMGDQVAATAEKNGWEGAVIHGVVRDVDEIDAIDVGVKALGSIPLKTDKRGEGQTDIVVRFGGVDFVPGHYVVADANGVVVSAKNIL